MARSATAEAQPSFAAASAARSSAAAPPIRLLGIPDRLDASVLGKAAVPVSPSELPDAVVLTQPGAACLLGSRLPAGLAAIIPVVDASRGSGQSGGSSRADFHITTPNRTGLSDAMAALGSAIERLRSLPASVLSSEDPRMTLLARLLVRDRGMGPRRDPHARDTVIYDDESAIASATRHAENLAALGLLHRQFFDMLTTCPRCDSARLCARERCAACGSTNLVEEAIFHHLRCAYQAPEHEFRTDRGFVCPKCRMPLEHFSVDYDRPGSLLVCRACGHASSEGSVGFLCLDCAVDSPAPETASRAIYRYEPTRAAHECVRNGTPLPPASSAMQAVTDRIRKFVDRQNATGRTFCILAVDVEEPPSVPRSREYGQTCSFLVSRMRETFTPDTEIIEAWPRLFALLADDHKAEVESALPHIRGAIEKYLSRPLTVRYAVYAPNEVQRVFDAASQTT